MKPFSYSVLKYRPSYLLDEQINLGLLFVFPEEEHVYFIAPNQLKRVTQLYPSASLKHIRNYLRHFKNKTNRLKAGEYWENLSTLTSELIAQDANSFYFSEFKYGKYLSAQETIKYYYATYFEAFEEKYKVRKDDSYLRKAFSQKLKKTNSIKSKLFKENYTIKNTISATTFDFAWQNGNRNLVKTIGFDLTDETYIQNKAFKWWGELSQLNKKAREEQFRIDILVTKPQKKGLFHVYDKALQVLEEIKTNHTITEEEKLDDYIDYAIESVRPLLD